VLAAVGAAALGAALAIAPGAGAASLPRVGSGERPGPQLLYERPPAAPELSNRAPFRAKPLLVSGTDAYRDGEYLYQDYLFDDRGADTLEGSAGQRDSNADFSPTSGNVFYPTAARFAQNAADLVELRVKPTRGAILYRVTLNTVKAKDDAIVGIGIDTNRSGGARVLWPGGAGVSSPGLDRFVTAWGTGGRVYRRDPATGELEGEESLDGDQVTINRRTNQMTIRVPRSVMNPGGATWRYAAGAGLRSARNGFKQIRPGPPTATEPGSGDRTEGAPGVFNLAFRFDEPLSSRPNPRYGQNVGLGNWFETKQAARLKRASPLSTPSTAGFHADVDFGRLAGGADERLHAPRQNQARIMSSSLEVPEGFRDRFPSYGGRLQPYFLRVPSTRTSGRPRGLTFSLHSLGATYTQYGVFSPTQLQQFGDERGNLVATPLGRGANGWYTGEGEADFFEVWRDVARNFRLDSERVALTGYSMGGYGTYRLGVLYPDLFGRAFTTVGPPARGGWVPPAPPFDPELGRSTQDTSSNRLLENARWVPHMNWVALMDELVPYPGPRAQQRRFDRLGLRSQLWTFPGQHFTLAVLDEWEAAKNFLGRSRVKRAPSRVNHAIMPDTQRPDLGLVQDHAYWVSGLNARDRNRNPKTSPARAEIDAISQAFGEDATPRTAPVTSAGGGPPAPSAVDGTRWTAIPARPRANSLSVQLRNMARATIDGPRARLDGARRLRVHIDSDGNATMRLELPLPAGARARRTGGPPVPGSSPEVTVDRAGATFRAARGSRTYSIAAE
jgi:poly(3-hydroxybutyrate) depolymerase